MPRFTVKELKEALRNLKDDVKVEITTEFLTHPTIEIKYIKELKDDGEKYYRLSL